MHYKSCKPNECVKDCEEYPNSKQWLVDQLTGEVEHNLYKILSEEAPRAIITNRQKVKLIKRLSKLLGEYLRTSSNTYPDLTK